MGTYDGMEASAVSRNTELWGDRRLQEAHKTEQQSSFQGENLPLSVSVPPFLLLSSFMLHLGFKHTRFVHAQKRLVGLNAGASIAGELAANISSHT